MCSVQRGEVLADDAMARCVEETGHLLASNPQNLPAYREVFAACQQYVVCQYVDCARAQR